MSRSIWKFPISLVENQMIDMPDDAQILTVQPQRDALVMWAIVTTSAPVVPVKICIYGTGMPVPDERMGRYISTIQDGDFVWHVFQPFRPRTKTKENADG